MTLKTSYATAQAVAFSHRLMMLGGKLRIFAGPEPDSADDSLGSAILLAELTLLDFSDPVNGEFIATSIAAEQSIKATGTASFYRVYTSEGDCFSQGSIGTSGEDMNLNSVNLTQGGRLVLDSFHHKVHRWQGAP